MSTDVSATIFGERPAVSLKNENIELIVLTGGGHIAAIRRANGGVNPLWEPSWPTTDPALRRLADPEAFGDSLESQLLCNISGHNLCVDVFGAHSPGEAAAGMCIHGESGLVTWVVIDSSKSDDGADVTLKAHLPETCIDLERRFSLAAGSDVVKVEETMSNLTGFQRAMGRAQHATIGSQFLDPAPCLFECNADQGMTWPEPVTDVGTTWAVNTQFAYPNIPANDGSTADWRRYPRTEHNSDTCTLRINPNDINGWFVAAQNACRLAVFYLWERAAFPWLMTWEENHERSLPPWNKRELTRGLEFSSYAFATSREINVAAGTLLETPTFEWLDAHESKRTTFYIGLKELDSPVDAAPQLAQIDDRTFAADSVGWSLTLD